MDARPLLGQLITTLKDERPSTVLVFGAFDSRRDNGGFMSALRDLACHPRLPNMQFAEMDISVWEQAAKIWGLTPDALPALVAFRPSTNQHYILKSTTGSRSLSLVDVRAELAAIGSDSVEWQGGTGVIGNIGFMISK